MSFLLCLHERAHFCPQGSTPSWLTQINWITPVYKCSSALPELTGKMQIPDYGPLPSYPYLGPCTNSAILASFHPKWAKLFPTPSLCTCCSSCSYFMLSFKCNFSERISVPLPHQLDPQCYSLIGHLTLLHKGHLSKILINDQKICFISTYTIVYCEGKCNVLHDMCPG